MCTMTSWGGPTRVETVTLCDQVEKIRINFLHSPFPAHATQETQVISGAPVMTTGISRELVTGNNLRSGGRGCGV